MKSALVLLALLSLGLSQTEECPNPVECAVNPCQTAICPRYLNARCEADNCNGECRAVFINIRNGRMIDPEKCEVEKCADKECDDRRTCVEEVFPADCAIDEPNCRQYLRAVCELPTRPRPPSDCSVVECDEGMMCEIYQRISGPEARCVPFRPQTCQELGPCDRGMECRMRARGNGLSPVVRCVPIFTRRHPRDCSELECNAVGFTCALFGAVGRQRARCVRERNLIRSCEELNCEAGGMICDETGNRPVCRSPRTCDEVTCPVDQVCSILSIPDIPVAFRCPFRENDCKLGIINKLEGDRILACRDQSLAVQSCEERECPDDKVCVGKSIENGEDISICLPKTTVSQVPEITTCDIVPDGFCSANYTCVHFNQNGYSGFAHCAVVDCQEDTCPEAEDSCVVSSDRFFEESDVSTSCAPVDRVGLIQDNTCSEDASACELTCTDIFSNNVSFGTGCIPLTIPTISCEELTCSEEETCVQDIVGSRVVRAACENSQFLMQLLNAIAEEL